MKLALVKGSTSVTVDIFVQDSSSTTGAGLGGLAFGTSGLVCYYKRPRTAWTQITLVTQTVTGAWSSGGFVENGVVTGSYRLDLPDAVCADAGFRAVQVALFGATNMAPVLLEIQLTTFDLSATAPNVTATNTVTATVASGGISSSSFAPAAIDANAIGTNAITNVKIADGAITNPKLGAAAIEASNIGAGAITAAKFAAGAIDATAIAANAIGANQLATNAITSAKIASNAIGASQIAFAAITNQKLATGCVTSDAMAVGAIAPAVIGNDAINALTIANNTITAAKIATDAVTSAKIANDAVTATKIQNGALTSAKFGTGYIQSGSFSPGAVDAAAIGLNAITDAKIADGAITNPKLGAAAIEASNIGAGAITAAKIADDAIDKIWDEPQAGHTTAGTFGDYLDAKVSTAGGGGGLTAQEVRDAMKLAPTAGTPDFGSVDQELDTALSGITTTIAAIGAQNDLSAQEVRDAMKLAPTAGTPAAGSIDEHLDDLVAEGDLTLLEEGTVGNQAGVAANELKLKQSGFGTINPIGAFLFHEAADGFKQARKILAWNSGDRIVTVDRDWYTQPTSGTYYVRGAFLSLTPQETRNTMKLAPSAGAPANDSIDDKVGDAADASAFLVFRENTFYTPKIGAIETSSSNAETFAAAADSKAGKILGLIDEGSLPFQSGVTDPNTQVKLDTTAPSLAASLTGCTVTVLTTPPQQRKITSYDDINKIVDIDQPWAQNPGQGTAYRVTLDTHAMLGQQASLLIGDKVEAELTTPYTSTANPTSLQGRMKRHDDLLEAGAGYNRYKATALEQAPSGGGGGANGFDELLNTTVQTVTSQTVWTLAAGPSNANALIGCMIVRSKPDGRISINRITGWAGGNQITVEATPNLTVEVGDTVKVVAKMPGESLTTEQVAAAIWGQTAATYQAQGTFGHTVGNSGANTSTIYSRVHALNDLTQQQVTDACDDALQNFNGPTVNDIATATRTEIDANGLGSQVIRSVTITQVTDAQNFRIDTPINGIADRFQRIAIVGKKTNARNPAVGRVISTVDTDGDVVANAPYPEAFQVGDQAVLVGYYLV